MSPFVIHLKDANDGLVFIERAAEVISEGKLIGFPTTTVYGMGCDPQNIAAVKQVFYVKNHPSDQGFPVLIADVDEARKIASLTDIELKLADNFWPGELTIIAPLKNPEDVNWLTVTGNKPTVALRVPRNSIPLEICRILKRKNLLGAIVGTSANFTGEPVITGGKEMIEMFSNMLDFIIEGGTCQSKIPSTIVRIDRDALESGADPEDYVHIIRKGTITKEDILTALTKE